MNAPLPLRPDASFETPAFGPADQSEGMLSELGRMSRRWQRVILVQSCALVFLAGVAADRGFTYAFEGRGDAAPVALHPVAIESLPDYQAPAPGEIAELAPFNQPAPFPAASTPGAETPEPSAAAEATIGGGPEPTYWAVGTDDKTVRGVIERWCLAGGYTLDWSTTADYPVPAAAKGHSYHGDLMAGVAGLAKTFGRLPTALTIKFDPNAGVLRVATQATSTKH